MHTRSYLARFIAGLALIGALFVPTIATADIDNGLTVVGNSTTTTFRDANGFTGSAKTTQDITVIGDGMTVIGNPRTTRYYDSSGTYVGSATTTSDVTTLGD